MHLLVQSELSLCICFVCKTDPIPNPHDCEKKTILFDDLKLIDNIKVN